MNIVMVTNTFTPHVGGVARSVEAFTAEYQKRGHHVLIIAPKYTEQAIHEMGVVRIPAIQNFNGSDFSFVLPVSGLLDDILDSFEPDIIHAHHPFLLGMTALRIARYRQLPLVFTHHTMYEQYTHYVPVKSSMFRRFIIELATCYANLSDHVFAPSLSIAELLQQRGVEVPITVIPTGVDTVRFCHGDGSEFRLSHDINKKAFVVGYLGRLAPEKNLEFLALAVAHFLKINPNALFVVVGVGPSESVIRNIFEQEKLEDRLHIIGIVPPADLTNAYHAMDVFAFASKSETQGMVLTEAMASGLPVIGLDAPGVREIIIDKKNGRLLAEQSINDFAECLQWIMSQTPRGTQQLKQAARETAEIFSMTHSVDKALACYETLCKQKFDSKPQQFAAWQHINDLIKAEWNIIKGMANATSAAFEEH